MRCPHCSINMSPVKADRAGLRSRNMMWYGNAAEGVVHHRIEEVACPECKGEFIIHVDQVNRDGPQPGYVTTEESNIYVLIPRVSSRPRAPDEVPKPLADLYNEAALILTDSPRASAAMSRRCLQQLLRDVATAPHGTLFAEIEWAVNGANLPSHVTESLHDLRQIGNFGVHPNKSTATGDYLEVEPGEAEWTLDTLDALFDHYFVQPAKTAARKASLQTKLTP
jgi:hypothetical protein